MNLVSNKLLRWFRKLLKVLGKFLLGLILLFFIVILFLSLKPVKKKILLKLCEHVETMQNAEFVVQNYSYVFPIGIKLKDIYFRDAFSEASIQMLKIKPNSFSKRKNSVKVKVSVSQGEIFINSESFKQDSLSTKEKTKKNSQIEKKNWIIGSDIKLDQVNFSFQEKESKIIIGVQVKDLSVDDAKIETIQHIVNWDDILVEDCSVNIKLDKKEETEETESKGDWEFEGENIALKKCYFSLNQDFKDFYLSTFVDDLEIKKSLVNLTHRIVEVEKLKIDLADVAEKIAVDTTKKIVQVKDNKEPWKVSLTNGKLTQIKFSHNSNEGESFDSLFSFQSFVVQNLDTKIKKAFYYDKFFGGTFNKLNLNLNDIFFLENSFIDCLAENEKTYINTKLNAGDSKISFKLDSDKPWKTFANLYDFPAHSFSLKLDHIFPSDLQYFIPKMNIVSEALNTPIFLKINAESDGSRIELKNFLFNMDPGLNIQVSGYFTELSEKGLFEFFSDYDIEVNVQAFEKLLTEKKIGSYLSKLNNLRTRGKINGDQDNIFIDQYFNSEYLKFPLSGNYNWNDSSYNLEIDDAFLAADSIFSFPVRLYSFDFASSGQLASDVEAEYALNVNDYSLSGKNLSKLALTGNLCDKQLDGFLTSTDSLLNANIEHSLTLGVSKNTSLSGDFKINNSGLIEQLPEGIFSGDLIGNFSQHDNSSFDADLLVNNFTAETTENNYSIQRDSIHLRVLEESFHASMENDFVSIDIRSGLSLRRFLDSIKNGLENRKEVNFRYISEFVASVSPSTINMKLITHPLIEDQFLKGRYGFENLSLDYRVENSSSDRVKIRIEKPSFKDINADSVSLTIGLSLEKFAANGSIVGLSGENLIADRVYLNSSTKQGISNVELVSYSPDGNTQLFSLFNIERDFSLLSIHFPTDSIILFGDTWTLNPDNLLTFSNSQIDSCDFELKSGNKIFRVGTSEDCPLYVEADDLDLGNISNVIFRENELKGIMDGKICFLNKSLNSFQSELEMYNMLIDGKGHGNYIVNSYYDVSDSLVAVFGGEVRYNDHQILQLDARTPGKEFKKSTINVKVSELELEPYSNLLSKYVNSISGGISGFLEMRMEDSKDGVKGELDYKNLVVNPKILNTELVFSDNVIRIENRLLKFNKIAAKDESGKKMKLNGEIKFPYGEDPLIYLNARADSMVLVNIPERKNNTFFGRAIATNDIEISGPIYAPKINYNMSLIRGTDITYRIVEDLSSNDGEGIVVFVSEDTLSENTDKYNTSLISQKKGTAIDANIIINPETIFRLLYEQNMKFTIRLSGSGKLEYLKKSNGEEKMKGKYSVRSGEAVMHLQGLAPKDFQIVPNSYIQWDGSSANPKLDILAYHKVKGSYQNPSSSTAQTMIVDYKVFFSIRNRLNNPEIVFDVNTDDDYMTSVLNSMPEEERIKQAINLLLLGQIVTENTKTSGSRIITDHLNQFWAQQLNNAAEDNLGGVSLNVDIQSFTDYSAGNQYDRTDLSYELSKKVWNDKATIKVGGYVSTYNNSPDQAPSRMIGDVSLEYELGKNENLYGKVFSDHKYEGVLEGEIQRTGAGLMYRKDYKTFKDIWRRKKKKKQELEKNNNK